MVYPKETYLGHLFIFYINDLPTDIVAKLLLFANDTKLIKMLLSMMSQDITAVIKFNLWRETCENWNTEHEMLSNAWRYDQVLNGYDPSLEHLFAVDNNSITRGHNFKLK